MSNLSDAYNAAVNETDSIKASNRMLKIISILREADKSATLEELINIVRENLGYLAGYHDQEVLTRVCTFYNTEHPIFGKVFPTDPKKILAAGMLLVEYTQQGIAYEKAAAMVKDALLCNSPDLEKALAEFEARNIPDTTTPEVAALIKEIEELGNKNES